MSRIIMYISCFVLAVLFSGCQDRGSVHSVNEIKHNTVEIKKNSEANNIHDIAAPSDKNGSTVIAFCFHRTMRCATCLAIEANVARVIETNFAEQLASGKLIWIPYNLDELGGDELGKEFDVSSSTLVLTKMQDGNHIKYKKLEKVWDFIGDPLKFDEYVQTVVKDYLNE